MNIVKQIILLTGYSGAGKTTLAHFLEGKGYKYLDYHQEFRKVALEKGYYKGRDYYFNERGNSFIEVRHRVIQSIIEATRSNNKIVFDGLYDYNLLEEIKIYKLDYELKIIGLIAEKSLRKTRVKDRNKLDDVEIENEILMLDEFRDELGIEKVLPVCDYLIYNNQTLEHFMKSIELIL